MDVTDGRFRQPDQRSCGAATLVMERLLRDAGYADLVAGARDPVARFAEEVLAMHRRVTGPVALDGRLQLPWPRALGTPPWAVSGQLTASRGRPHRVAPLRLSIQRETGMAAVRAALAAGSTVPLYLGNAWLPRHVVLVLDERLTTWDPATGGLAPSRWPTPWAAVLPDP